MPDDDKNEDLKQTKMKLEVEKLQEEVKKARRENRIWIIGLLIAVAGFGLTNLNTIKGLVIREPRIRLAVEDPFVKRVGVVRIAHTSGGREVEVETSVNEAEEWFTLQPGSYELEVAIEGRIFYSQKLLLKAGDSEIIMVPERETGSIRVVVKNHTPNPRPGEPLDLSIESSGNGFLWVFDHSNEGKFIRIYPDPATPAIVAEIRADTTYTIPDAKGVKILTNKDTGQERLLFVVTSLPSAEDAQKIATRMSEAVISKANIDQETANWGIANLEYNVSW